MSLGNTILYTGGVGPALKEQEEKLPELFEPYGFNVEFHPFDYGATDAREWLDDTGENLKRLSVRGSAFLLSTSGGAKLHLSLAIRNPDDFNGMAMINGKVPPYDLTELNPSTLQKLPNLVLSSNILEEDLPNITKDVRRRVLSVNSQEDEEIAPKHSLLEGGAHHTMPVHGHLESLKYGLTTDIVVIVDFFRRLRATSV